MYTIGRTPGKLSQLLVSAFQSARNKRRSVRMRLALRTIAMGTTAMRRTTRSTCATAQFYLWTPRAPWEAAPTRLVTEHLARLADGPMPDDFSTQLSTYMARLGTKGVAARSQNRTRRVK